MFEDKTTASFAPPIDLLDPDTRVELKRIRTQMRRLITLAGEAGRWSTTVGAIAKATKLPPVRVANQLRAAWLVILIEKGPIESWTVEEDGE